jgi:hypothetical protein
VRNPDGKAVQFKSASSTIQKIAPKIIKFPTLTGDIDGSYGTLTGKAFDRSGKAIGSKK